MFGKRFLIGLAVLFSLELHTTFLAYAQDLTVVGPAQREVRLVHGTGQLTVVLRNRSAHTVRPTISYEAADGSVVSPLTPGDAVAERAGVGLQDARAALAPLPGGATRDVVIDVAVAPDTAPRDLVGKLRFGATTVVTLRGAPPDLRFDPPTLTLAISQACWRWLSRCGDAADIVVRGRDARRWAEGVHQLGSAVLHNDRGGTLRVWLKTPKIRDGTVVARVDTAGPSHPGRYAGPLPVDAAGLAGPALQVEATVRWSLGSAVAIVFLGSLMGGFFLRRFEIRRRRRLLELELLSALGRYDEAKDGKRTFSFDLDSQLEPRRPQPLPFPGTRGVSALLWHIRNAADDEDFAEDVARTHELIANIERWLALEPIARQATLLLEDAIPPSRERGDFTRTIAYRDLARLRMRASETPVSDAECRRLIDALVLQSLIVSKCKVVWMLLREIESRSGWTPEQATVINDHDLARIEERFPALGERTPEQSEGLRLALEEAERTLTELCTDVDVQPWGEASIEQARQIEQTLTDKRARVTIGRELPEFSHWGVRLHAALNQLALRSVLWTLARALVAVAGYTLTIYDDTWGSATDFASAFTTGFLTETLVNWAVLPAFRSIRSRRSAPHATTGTEVPSPSLARTAETNGRLTEPISQGRTP